MNKALAGLLICAACWSHTSSHAQQYCGPDGCPPQYGYAQPPMVPVGPQVPALPQAVRDAIVQVEVGNHGGSGALIASDERSAIVVTAAHVTEGGGSAVVHFVNGESYEGNVIASDRVQDIAAIQIGATRVKPLQVETAIPSPGEALALAGFGPSGSGFGVTRGNMRQVVSFQPTGFSNIPEAIEMSGPARKGDSGGPILNSRFHVVGVLAASGDGVTCGCSCVRLRKFLSALRPRNWGKPKQQRPQPAPLPGEGQVVQDPNIPPAIELPETPAPVPATPAPDTSLVDKLNADLKRANEAFAGLQTEKEKLHDKLKAAEALAAKIHDSPAGPIIEHGVGAALTALGLPGWLVPLLGGAGAGGALTWLVRRGSKQGRGGDTAPTGSGLSNIPAERAATITGGQSSSVAQPAPLPEYHNRYVPFETNIVSKAWADAHAILVEQKPGYRIALTEAERLVRQILAGEIPKLRGNL